VTIIDIPFAAAPGRRLLFRFVGAAEYRNWMALVPNNWDEATARQADNALAQALVRLIHTDDFGDTIHNFTMTAQGGGVTGTLMATTADLARLIGSTDDAVQRIIRGAEYVLVFSVPQDACINAPSPLSVSEAEVLVPYLPRALCHMIYRQSTNPYNRDQRS
jgi:hypothetical protein